MLVLVGITLVGASSFAFPAKDDKGMLAASNEIGPAYIISIGLLLLSVVMNGL
jgi:hypothetical protein